MTAILYPVAHDAEEALDRPLGRAARARQAGDIAAGAVRFVTEEVGPAFPSREAALDAYAGRLDDERPGKAAQPAPEDRYCQLREVIAASAAPPPAEPAFVAGRRWPKPPRKAPAHAFRLSISYWRIGSAEQQVAPVGQARTARRRSAAAQLSAEELRAMANQPLRPVRPQQPLEVGLFENPAPEAPHILIPDD
ncbi:MAG: hypothetical protein JO127_00250 [Caulobacteraceae bacterium]|nr:hypothetical protein [Caulobacteraceae bacterium]